MSLSKRMISTDVIESDSFIFDLSKDAKLLYLLCCIESDPLGVISSFKRICKNHDIEESTIEELVHTGFIIEVNHTGRKSEYIVKHNWVHNNRDKQNDLSYIRNRCKNPCIVFDNLVLNTETREYLDVRRIDGFPYVDICDFLGKPKEDFLAR